MNRHWRQGMPHPFDRYHALITTEELDPAHVQAMLRLRKRLFVDHCGWMLATIGDLERDQFDTWYTEHCLLFSGSDLVGGFRAWAERPDGTFVLLHGEIVARTPSRPEA